MATLGNRAAADIGGGGGTPVQRLAKMRITYKNKPKDLMPKGVRKQTDKVDRLVGQASALGTNVDALLRKVSGKRLGLPKGIKRGLDNPIGAVGDVARTVTRRG